MTIWILQDARQIMIKLTTNIDQTQIWLHEFFQIFEPNRFADMKSYRCLFNMGSYEKNKQMLITVKSNVRFFSARI